MVRLTGKSLTVEQRQTVEYLVSLLNGLHPMIEEARLPLVSHFLQMACIEAGDILRGTRSADGEDLVDPRDLSQWASFTRAGRKRPG